MATKRTIGVVKEITMDIWKKDPVVTPVKVEEVPIQAVPKSEL